jgi:hypothetical protein
MQGVTQLYYPASAAIEMDNTTPCSDRYFGKKASIYINGDLPFSPEILDAINKTDESDPVTNLEYLRDLMKKYSLGNAVRLTAELGKRYVEGKKTPIPDLNLDGDRGIAYKCWKVVNDTPVTSPVKIDII